MNLPHGLLEIEILVHLLRRDAHVAPRRQAPVVGLDLGPVHPLDQAIHVPVFSVRKTIQQPRRLPPEIPNPLQLFGRKLPGLAHLLQGLGNLPGEPVLAFLRRQRFLAGFHQLPAHLLETVHFLGKRLRAIGKRRNDLGKKFPETLGAGIQIEPAPRRPRAIDPRTKGRNRVRRKLFHPQKTPNRFRLLVLFLQGIQKRLDLVPERLHRVSIRRQRAVLSDFLPEAVIRRLDAGFQVVRNQNQKPRALLPMQPNHRQQILLLLRAEIINLPRHLPVDVPGVDHQHRFPAFRRFGPVEKPQLARHGPSVEKIGADGDHGFHVAGLHQILPDRRLGPPRAGRLGGHHEPRPARFVQIAVKIADPDVIPVGNSPRAFLLLLLARFPLFLLRPLGLGDARQPEGKTEIAFHLPRVDFVHVERRIGHHEIGLAHQLVGVFIVGDGLLDVPLQPVDRQIHLGQPDGGGVLFHPVEGQPLGRVRLPPFHEMGALDEHAAGAAGRIQHHAPFRLQHVGDERNQGNRCEEFAVVVGLQVRELGQEILVNPAEHVSAGVPKLLRIQGPDQRSQHVVVQLPIFLLGQGSGQIFVIRLDGFHGRNHGAGHVGVPGFLNQIIELGLRPEEDGAFAGKIFRRQRPGFSAPLRQRRLDLRFRGPKPVEGVAQKHQPHHRQEVLVAGVVGIGPQRIRRVPQPSFNGGDVLQLPHRVCSLRRGCRFRGSRREKRP